MHTAPAGCCRSCGCCLSGCGLWSGSQRNPQTPPGPQRHRVSRSSSGAAGLQPPYLVLFGALGQDGSALPPVRPLVPSQLPQEGLVQVAVPQQDPQAALGLPLELVVELQAERASLRLHLRAQQPGLLLLAVAAGVQVQIVPRKVWKRGGEGRQGTWEKSF